MLVRLLAFLLLFSGSALAQTIAIRAGHLVDPATGTVTDNQTILVKDGKIVAVGAQVRQPADARVIDLSDSWVLPGLIDAHTHITMNLPPAPTGVDVWADYFAHESTALRALQGVANARAMLEAGFTAVRDVGNAANYADTDLRKAIERGWIVGPTIVNTGKIIAPFGGQFKKIAPEQGPVWQFEYIDADTPAEVRKAVRQNIFYGATAIKLVADNSPFHYSEAELRAAVEETHAAGLKIAIHVYGDDPGRAVVLAGADSIEHGFELSDDLLRLMKEKGTVLVGTDFPTEHLVQMGGLIEKPKKEGEKILDRLRRAYRVGVKMAFGSDVVVDLPGEDRGQMTLDYLAVWTAAGIPPAAILKAMTTNAAELLGFQDERGAIAAGQAADIIATPANPLDDIQALRGVHFVMKDGRLIKRPRQVSRRKTT